MPNTDNFKKNEESLELKLREIELKREEEEYKNKASDLGLKFIDLRSVVIDIDALSVLSEKEARESYLVPFSRRGPSVSVAIINPNTESTKKSISDLKSRGYSLEVYITSPHILEFGLGKYKNVKEVSAFEIGTVNISEEELKKFQEEIRGISDLKNKVTQITTTKMLEVLIAGALNIEASDIHFEAEKSGARLRYRIDGVLNDITSINTDSYSKLLNRIKVLSKLKINIHGAPQDGRFTIKQGLVDIEVRVSVLPSEYGETTVMRLLDPRKIKQNIEDLGIRPELMEIIKEQLGRPNGSIFTTGPTGSGKTTSLYAFINYINNPHTKIITIEDPIEYHIQGISQTQVEPDKGYTFANGLRAIVRQDPDIILVGEIRDRETAEIALNAALTGHIVLTTIHTNNAAGTIPRLIDLGVKPQIIAPAINLAMAQRLVRRLCPKCKVEIKQSPDLFKKIKEKLGGALELPEVSNFSEQTIIYGPGKCNNCNQTGYKGRVGVYEAFKIDRDVEELILKNAAASEIQDTVIAKGFITMSQDGYIKVIKGVTSIEEIERVIE